MNSMVDTACEKSFGSEPFDIELLGLEPKMLRVGLRSRVVIGPTPCQGNFMIQNKDWRPHRPLELYSHQRCVMFLSGERDLCYQIYGGRPRAHGVRLKVDALSYVIEVLQLVGIHEHYSCLAEAGTQ